VATSSGRTIGRRATASSSRDCARPGAIILAKSNLGEYASGIPRSSWGGLFSNPYYTERSPMGSSSAREFPSRQILSRARIGEETGDFDSWPFLLQ